MFKGGFTMFRMFKKNALMCDYTYFSTQLTWSVVFNLVFMFIFDNNPDSSVFFAFLPELETKLVKIMLFISLTVLTSLYMHMGHKELKSWSNNHIVPVIGVMIASFVISLKLAKLLIQIF